MRPDRVDFRIANPTLVEALELFAVCTPWNAPFFDMLPFGLPIPEANRFDPLRLKSERFLELLERMDGLTFGPEGMPMPRWVFYNGSELPGGIVGFARRAGALTAHQRQVMGVQPDEDLLVPLSMFIAIPMLPRGAWMGHNLASMNGVFPKAGLKGLASVTKAFGLRVYRTRVQYGATQWHSLALHIHTKFGLLDLVTAFTPAHSDSMTLTYRVAVTDEGLRNALGDPQATLARPKPEFWLRANDEESAERLQIQIEAGARYAIVGRPSVDEDGVRKLPICERPAS